MKRWVGKLLRSLVGLLILAVGYLGLFSLVAARRVYPITGRPAAGATVRGAYHVHSTASDGSGDIAEIARAARSAGLSFVVVTDHNLARLPPPSFVDGVLVIREQELSTPWGHLVAIGASRALTPAERAQDPVGATHELKGHAVLSHPVQPRNPWRNDEAARRADAFELYSADTFLRRALGEPALAACALGTLPANPAHALMSLVGPEPEAHERLLALSTDRPLVAVCAHDAHGHPSYRSVFGALSMHLPLARLPSDASEAAELVRRTMISGHALCAFDALGDAGGFALEGLLPGRVGRVGQRLRVRLPDVGSARAQVRAYGAARVDGEEVVLTRSGPAQIEVHLESPDCGLLGGKVFRPWIVPSPFQVLPEGDGGTP